MRKYHIGNGYLEAGRRRVSQKGRLIASPGGFYRNAQSFDEDMVSCSCDVEEFDEKSESNPTCKRKTKSRCISFSNIKIIAEAGFPELGSCMDFSTKMMYIADWIKTLARLLTMRTMRGPNFYKICRQKTCPEGY